MSVRNFAVSGAVGPSDPLATLNDITTVLIGSKIATVYFSGLAPGFVALYQVNLQVPLDAPLGDSVPVQIFSGGVSNTPTIAIR